jgi:hypothetical protein
MGKEVCERDSADPADLREIHRQLEWLAEQAMDYPVECSVGEYDLLFDSHDDIEMLLEHLNSELRDDRSH